MVTYSLEADMLIKIVVTYSLEANMLIKKVVTEGLVSEATCPEAPESTPGVSRPQSDTFQEKVKKQMS